MNVTIVTSGKDVNYSYTVWHNSSALRTSSGAQSEDWDGPAGFPAGVLLAEEEHDQEREDITNLLIAQRQLDCQFQHGICPVYAGSAANWLRVGYLLHAVAWRGSWLTANGLERRLWLLSIVQFYAIYRYSAACEGRPGREPCRIPEFFNFLTLSRVVARQLGLLAQVRYPARGSARVTPPVIGRSPVGKHNRSPARGGNDTPRFCG